MGRSGLRLARLVERLTRRFPTVGFVLITSVLYLGLLARIFFASLKVAVAKLIRSGPKATPRSKTFGPLSRLLLAELKRIEELADAGILPEEIGKSLKWLAGTLSASGRVALAEQFYDGATRYLPHFSSMWIDCMESLAVLRFMQGNMQGAIPCFAEVAETRSFLRHRPGIPRHLRVLAGSWFAALGHVAMLDFLLKKQQLGWEDPNVVFVATNNLSSAPGKTLLLELEGRGIKFGGGAEFHAWDSLERAALLQEFWEMDFPDGEGLCYSHAAAKIQNRWETEGRPATFGRRDEADEALQYLRRQLGIPDGAWYVCVHVRESGFHDRWNKMWEQARDADIHTYASAIELIVQRGGCVVRMGDPTMKRLERMPGLIDYAHSNLKSEYADILLISGARFFVGTNSGLSIIPGLYGVPSVLTNWVPIGLPNWFGNDLMIPKLIMDRDSNALVSVSEMLSSDLGYVQNPRNLPRHLEFVDNTAEELHAVVAQMLCELDGKSDHDVRDRGIEEAYFSAAETNGSYRGSRIGTAFARKYSAAFGLHLKSDVASQLEEPSELVLAHR